MGRRETIRRNWYLQHKDLEKDMAPETLKDFRELKISSSDDGFFICNKHGLYKQRLGRHVGCPKCMKSYHPMSEQVRISRRKEWISRYKDSLEDMTSEDKFKLGNCELSLEDKAHFICSIHGEYLQSIKHHVFSKSGCPLCSNIKASIAKRPLFVEKYKDLLKDMDSNDLERLKRGELRIHDKARFICPIHGEYLQTIKNHVYDYELNTCPKCHSGNYRSSLEVEIGKFLEDNKVHTEYNRRGYLPDRMELDIVAPSLKLAIEVNGSAFHSTLGLVAKGYKLKDSLYHQRKFIQAENIGIHLISIFDIDWEENKEKIKKYLLSLIKFEREYARNCLIKEVELSVAKEFLEKYHLQGFSNKGTINLGLYKDNDLLAVMSFGVPRFNLRYSYELHRFATKDNLKIIGGASKLFKFFLKKYKPKTILSYSDNDFFTGGVYKVLGFSFEGFTKPRYFWWKSMRHFTREQCMLKNLKREFPGLYEEACKEGGNKEDYIMTHLGYGKVYRTGNKKWVYKL